MDKAKLKLYSNSEFIESKGRLPTSKNLCFKRLSVHENWIWITRSSIKKAKELNFNKVWLSVLNSNERAINFYKKNRFEKIGNHDFSN